MSLSETAKLKCRDGKVGGAADISVLWGRSPAQSSFLCTWTIHLLVPVHPRRPSLHPLPRAHFAWSEAGSRYWQMNAPFLQYSYQFLQGLL